MAERPLRIVIPGGTGQLGNILARHFHEHGHYVTTISRHPKPAEWNVVGWNAQELGAWTSAMDRCDVLINLAGKNFNCRQNAANRREIRNSRTITTGLVGRAIAELRHPPALWLNASTAAVYPQTFDNCVDEADKICDPDMDCPSRWRFSVDVALSWERALFASEAPRTRRIALRSGMVMSPESGGSFDSFLAMVRYGLGGRAGSGRQYVSWIHDVDFVRAVDYLITHDEVSGIVNLCSPCPVPNKAFMRCLRQSWCTMYLGLPMPRWLLDIGAAFAGVETEFLLKSRRVIPGRLMKSGFDFHFPNWRAAAQDLVSRWRDLHAN